MPPTLFFVSLLLAVWLLPNPLRAETAPRIVLAAAPQSQTPDGKEDSEEQLTPEEKMKRRFPQSIRVGDLLGLPVLDWRDSTIGFVTQVVRTPAGKIQLIVPYGRWFGWISNGGVFEKFRRPVAVPLETVAILGRQVAALDMPREHFDAAPAYVPSQAVPLDPNHTIRIAITRR